MILCIIRRTSSISVISINFYFAIKNRVLYFYEINSHQITLNDTLLDLTN